MSKFEQIAALASDTEQEIRVRTAGPGQIELEWEDWSGDERQLLRMAVDAYVAADWCAQMRRACRRAIEDAAYRRREEAP